MLKNVPDAALQGDRQNSILSELLHEGHGKHVRLLSWVDEQLGVSKYGEYGEYVVVRGYVVCCV